VKQALLIMDMQRGIVDRFSDQAEALTATIAEAVAHARASQIPVLFVRVALRSGTPEVSSNNQAFASIAGSVTMDETGPATQIVEGVGMRESDILVTKRRVSAFTGSDLEVLLRSLAVDGIVLAGLATSGVVLSTTRQAADLDYAITILSDGCADADPEVHRVLIDKVFPRQARVLTTREWIEAGC